MIPLWLLTFVSIAATAAVEPLLRTEPDDSYAGTTEDSGVNLVENVTPNLLEQINVSLSFENMKLKNLPDGFVRSKFLTHLNLEGSQIEMISPLAFEFVPRLSHLSLANNFLRNIDLDQFSTLKNLETLNLNGNCKETMRAVIEETTARPLYFGRYDYEYHERSGPPRVISIPCHVNLSAEVTSLTKLYLENNNLKQLTFSGGVSLPLLTHLYLAGNQLSINNDMMSSLGDLAPSLSDLHLENCNVYEFDTSALSTITSLYLDGNSISCICNEYCDRLSLKLRAARSLKTLSASRNSISKIEADAFDNATSLVTLDLSNNKIPEIREGTFGKLYQLRSLSLEHNNLVDASQLYALRGLINLETLSLGYNGMRIITEATFENLVRLKTLALDHNKISEIDSGTFSKLTSLETLSLAGNRLSRIHGGCLPTSGSLVTLNLNDNKFTNTEYIPLADLPNLLVLSLEDNPLTTMILHSRLSTSENLTISLGNTC